MVLIMLQFSYCYSDVIHASAIPIVRRAEEMFPGGIAILSNSAGSSDDEGWKMADKTEENIGLPVIRHMVKKPGCLNEVLSHFEGRMNKNITPKQICVIGKEACLSLYVYSNIASISIGDRVMTDVVFANQYDMISVLVDPLSSVRDHPAAIVFRFLELQLLLPIIKWYLNTCCKSSKK